MYYYQKWQYKKNWFIFCLFLITLKFWANWGLGENRACLWVDKNCRVTRRCNKYGLRKLENAEWNSNRIPQTSEYNMSYFLFELATLHQTLVTFWQTYIPLETLEEGKLNFNKLMEDNSFKDNCKVGNLKISISNHLTHWHIDWLLLHLKN